MLEDFELLVFFIHNIYYLWALQLQSQSLKIITDNNCRVIRRLGIRLLLFDSILNNFQAEGGHWE